MTPERNELRDGSERNAADGQPSATDSELVALLHQLQERPKVEGHKLMPIPEAAAYLGVSESLLYQLVRFDEFPVRPRRIGGRRYFSRDELDEWLRTSTHA